MHEFVHVFESTVAALARVLDAASFDHTLSAVPTCCAFEQGVFHFWEDCGGLGDYSVDCDQMIDILRPKFSH